MAGRTRKKNWDELELVLLKKWVRKYDGVGLHRQAILMMAEPQLKHSETSKILSILRKKKKISFRMRVFWFISKETYREIKYGAKI